MPRQVKQEGRSCPTPSPKPLKVHLPHIFLLASILKFKKGHDVCIALLGSNFVLTQTHLPSSWVTLRLYIQYCPASRVVFNSRFFHLFSLKILARLMTAKFLHTEIREKGGAYGGGARLSYGGIFTLYSYR